MALSCESIFFNLYEAYKNIYVKGVLATFQFSKISSLTISDMKAISLDCQVATVTFLDVRPDSEIRG